MSARAAASVGRSRAALLLAVAALVGGARRPEATPPDHQPTFNQDVAPLLQRKCVSCHQDGGDAPFALDGYAEVRRRAHQIVQVTTSGYMPPWQPAADSLPLLGERRLSAAEKSTLARWVAAGAPEGPGPRPTSLARTAKGWMWGPPDLVVDLPAYTLAADGGDVFRNFVVRVPFEGTRYVRGFQLRAPGGAVHHANIRIDPTPASAELDRADPEPGYDGVILRSAEYPDGHFLGWTPGQAQAPDDELAWRLDGGTDLVVQLHMRTTGKPEPVQTSIGFYFSDHAPSRTPALIRLGKQDLHIPAGDSNFSSVDSFVTPVAATVMAIQPHAHYRARTVSVTATLPGGMRRLLLRIDDWNFNWQDQYRLAQPFSVPAGTRFESVYRFDNSSANPRNPDRPPQAITWGWRSSDEMADVWLQVVADSARDRAALARAAQHKATVEDATGAEVLIAREPSHFNLRNDAALAYMELGDAGKALEHFAAARRLRPDLPSAAYNEGVALEALGRFDEAAAQYNAAVALDPEYAPARARLGRMHYRAGRRDDAVADYRRALALDPRLTEARCEMAQLLVETNDPHDALTEYRTALAMRADEPACLVNLTWLLAAHEDATIRQPKTALETGQHAVDATEGTTGETVARDAYAAALASAGRFDEAVAMAARAAALCADPHQRDDINGRLALYEHHRPFVVSTTSATPR